VASAFLPALAQNEGSNYYVLLENRTDDTVRFQVAWSNESKVWTYLTTYKGYSIPPHDTLFFESPESGLPWMQVKIKEGGAYACKVITSSMGARYAFKSDQDNVVLVRLK
jgi:hypothetical protein